MKTKNKTGFVLSVIAAMTLIVGGIFLMGWLLNKIPTDGTVVWWDIVLGTALSVAPILAGGFWIGSLYRKSRKRGDRKGVGNGIVFGLVLILIGLFMLSFSAGIFPEAWRPVFISWQMLLIVIGMIQLFKLHVIPGLTLIILGNFFLVPRISRVYPESWWFGENFVQTYWPMLLIAFGILIVLAIILKPRYFRQGENCRRNEARRKKRGEKWEDADEYRERTRQAYGKDGMVEYDLLFTGAEQVFLDPVFRGGEINVVFAGITLDLRKTTLQEGESFLEISTVFGGANIIVPPEWRIEVRNHSILGGFNDKRPAPLGVVEDDTRKLVIIANCILGGGEIQ